MKLTNAKIKPKLGAKIDAAASLSKRVPIVTSRNDGTVEIYHSQDIKLSQNYQSIGCSYGVKLVVPDNDKAVTAGIVRAERIVETPLVAKVQQQKDLLNTL